MLRRQTLTAQLVEHLLNMIKSGQVKPGEKLPSEQELMAQLGVSRTCVREAVKSLESLRLIEARPGTGTVVLDPSPTSLLLAERFWDHGEERRTDYLLEFRQIIEIGVASLAAQRADESNIAALQDALDRFRSELKTGRVSAHTDLAFHAALAAASKNPMVVSVWEAIAERLTGVVAAVNESSYCAYAAAETEREHEELLQAIKRRDPEAAADIMRAHLHNAEVICRVAVPDQLNDVVSEPTVPLIER
ncbi:MAG: FadR family transcriptional regulator [Bryobacterales bacterium]|nr:FadR family transcriptional regulator [Bryobacterales bacterium]